MAVDRVGDRPIAGDHVAMEAVDQLLVRPIRRMRRVLLGDDQAGAAGGPRRVVRRVLLGRLAVAGVVGEVGAEDDAVAGGDGPSASGVHRYRYAIAAQATEARIARRPVRRRPRNVAAWRIVPNRLRRSDAEPERRRSGSAGARGTMRRRSTNDSMRLRSRPTIRSSPPKCVDRLIVGDARHMERRRRQQRGAGRDLTARTSPARSTRRPWARVTCRRPTSTTSQQLRDVFAECVRVLEPGGRIAVNVANLGRRPYRSLSADVTTILQDDLRLLLRGEVLWVKQRGAAGNCAWGSFQRPGNPVLRDLSERVIIASKGRFDRAITAKQRAKSGLPSISTMTRDEFMEATVDVWEIPPERASRVGHPAPFPGCAARAAHPHEHLCRRPRARPVRRLRLHCSRGGAHRPAVHRLRHRTRIRRGGSPSRRRGEQPSTLGRRSSCWRTMAARPNPLRGGWSSKESPSGCSTEAGFTEHRRPGDGHARRGADAARRSIAPDRTWWFEVVGGRTSNRPGAVRIDLLWRAISKGAVVREIDPAAGFVILTVDQPAAASGGRALGRRDRRRQTRDRGRRHAVGDRGFDTSPRWETCHRAQVIHGSRRAF